MGKPVTREQALKDAWEAVNCLGASDSACADAADLEYCHGIGEVLALIEALEVAEPLSKDFANLGPMITKGGANVGRMVSKTMAKRAANALNAHQPNREGV